MRAVTLLLCSLATLPCAAGNVYKWKDASGQTHYSQTPPPDGAVAAKPQNAFQPGASLQAPAPPSTPAAAPKPAAFAATPESPEAKAKRCTESAQRLAYLEEKTARRLMVVEADGSESRMTEEQFAARVAKAQAAGKGC